MLSAQLDGEDDPADRARVDEHLAGCAGCREWLDRAATVNRLTRTGLVAEVPDLTAAILAAAAPRAAPRAHRRGRLYVALAAVGAVQLILGLAQVGGGASGGHVHTGLDATPGHLWHESAAWNVAVGAGYLFIALRRNRPTGLVPMLTAFVGTLLLLSVNDLIGRPGRRHPAGQPRLRDRRIPADRGAVPGRRPARPAARRAGVGLAGGISSTSRSGQNRPAGSGWCRAGR